MEASDGVIRGNVDSLMKLISALDLAGVQLISEGTVSESGGRGIRLKADFDPAKLSGGEHQQPKSGEGDIG